GQLRAAEGVLADRRAVGDLRPARERGAQRRRAAGAGHALVLPGRPRAGAEGPAAAPGGQPRGGVDLVVAVVVARADPIIGPVERRAAVVVVEEVAVGAGVADAEVGAEIAVGCAAEVAGAQV